MSQWSDLLENLGIWEGSFTRLSPSGNICEEVPSQVVLEGQDHNDTVRQTIRFFTADGRTQTQEHVLEYSSLSRSVLVFASGAFSQGSMQYGPFSAFGAEFGLKQGNRRLRLVQRYDAQAQLEQLTLIREHRQGTEPAHQPPLTVAADVGEWRGDAVTLYPDWSPASHTQTQCWMELQGDRIHYQSDLGLPSQPSGLSAGADDLIFQINQSQENASQIRGDRLLTPAGDPAIQWLGLADGCFSLCPMAVPRQQSFSLQVGWHTSDRQRQRLLRHYDATGAWVGLTWVTEYRV